MRFRKLNSVVAAAFLAISLAWITWPPPTFAWAASGDATLKAGTSDSWVYPLSSHEVLRDFLAPNSDYSAGHRGVDFAGAEGEPVLSVAAGVVRFAGQVGGRGVVSVSLANGYVAEVEPVCPIVANGEQVVAGQTLATLCSSGSNHCPQACLHVSARRFSTEYARGFAYLSPLLFFGTFSESHLVAIGSLG